MLEAVAKILRCSVHYIPANPLRWTSLMQSFVSTFLHLKFIIQTESVTMIHFFLAVVALTLRRKLKSSIPVSYIQFLLSGDYPQGGRMIYVKLTWVSLDAALLMVSSLFVIHPSWIVWHNCTFDHITAAYEFSFVVDKNYIILWQSGSLAKNPILLYTKPPTPLWGKFGSEYVTPSFNPGVLLYIYVGAWPLW